MNKLLASNLPGNIILRYFLLNFTLTIAKLKNVASPLTIYSQIFIAKSFFFYSLSIFIFLFEFRQMTHYSVCYDMVSVNNVRWRGKGMVGS